MGHLQSNGGSPMFFKQYMYLFTFLFVCAHGHVCGGMNMLTCALGGGDQRPITALVPEVTPTFF